MSRGVRFVPRVSESGTCALFGNLVLLVGESVVILLVMRKVMNACISLQVWVSGLRALVFWGNQFCARVSVYRAEFWTGFSRECSHSAMLISVVVKLGLRYCLFPLLLAGLGIVASEGSNIPPDKLALLNFKSHIIEDPEGVLSSWNTSLHFCNWVGVTCSLKHQRITRLDLQAHQLTGTISPAIGNLSFLRSLDHGDNAFHGEIPLELSHLSRLQNLNLSFNFLTGTIPANLSRCSDLANLLLDHNYLVDHIPPQLGSLSNLVLLYLKNNNLTGTVPGTIGNLTSLQELYLSYNYNLEGELPDSMSQMRSLTMLGLLVNRLSGLFPHSLYNLSSLELISLSFNKFTGSVPMSFGNLQSLWWFNVLDNDLGSGRPDDLSFITSLTNCSQIEFLDIADNRFGGVLPSSIANLSTQLTKLLVCGNKIHGTIPVVIANLFNLDTLSMGENFLTGESCLSFKSFSLRYLSNVSYSWSSPIGGGRPLRLTLGCRSVLFVSLADISHWRRTTIPLTIRMQGNLFEGNILALSGLKSIQYLDLSPNNLSGLSPQYMAKLSTTFESFI
ncbi:hypothetical protein TEA_007028 [Camellia sinensis var. sinensis]|uniref:Uncharacterized protein n=1 Tax=Camellia sinensis var. sinensis TaxID=542762 RepID=A0A4S4D9B6_CAMSN|nr:hypothetical protein TEA_007028 [Camellia sinensis var. sinensis]